MAPNRKEHLRYRYGICLNDSCSKCKSKEVQQIAARKELICEECQKPLRECPPPKTFRDKFGKIIIGAVVVVIAIVLILIFTLGSSDSNESAPEPQRELISTDTVTITPNIYAISTYKVGDATERDTTLIGQVTEPIEQATDTLKADSIAVAKGPEGVTEVKDGGDTKPAPTPKSSIKVPFGVYSGPASGLDGEIRVTRNYTLDLRNAAHESIQLQPGDVITRTKFKNGELVGGYWKRGAESRSFHR